MYFLYSSILFSEFQNLNFSRQNSFPFITFAFALIPNQRIGQYISQAPVVIPEVKVNISQVFDQNGFDINNVLEGETIRETAQCIIQYKLSERDAKAISRTLEKTSSDAIVILSYLSRL